MIFIVTHSQLHNSSDHVMLIYMIPPQLTVQCHCKNTAPYEMVRRSTIIIQQIINLHISPMTTTRYKWNTEQWNKSSVMSIS